MERNNAAHPDWEEIKSIETDRLVLRALRDDDAEDIIRFAGDHDTAYWAGMAPVTNRDVALELIDSGNWFEDEPQYGITVKGDDTVIGLISVYAHSLEVYTLGYLISPEHCGKGYMSEAVAAVCDWFFATVRKPFIKCEIRSDNPASRRVALKCGFVQNDAQTEWRTNLYGKPLDEFFLYNPAFRQTSIPEEAEPAHDDTGMSGDIPFPRDDDEEGFWNPDEFTDEGMREIDREFQDV